MRTFWQWQCFFSWGFLSFCINLRNCMVGIEWSRNDVTLGLICCVITVDTTDWASQ